MHIDGFDRPLSAREIMVKLTRHRVIYARARASDTSEPANTPSPPQVVGWAARLRENATLESRWNLVGLSWD